MDNHQTQVTPHVLLFPLPLQGPVNCMLKLAELFCFHNLQVTFLNTDHIQLRLLNYTDISCRFKPYAKNFRFKTLPDGLPDDNPRNGERLGELLDSMEAVSLPLFREMVRYGAIDAACDTDHENPLTCIIADGAFSYAVDVAREFGVEIMYFDTISPCGLWALLCANKLIEAGEFPFKDDDLDAPVTSIPGMEGFLRCRDLPSFFRLRDQNDPLIQRVIKEEQQMRLAKGLIFNSFEDLEGPILSQLQTLVPNIYAIGPLHTHHKTILAPEKASKPRNSTNSIWKENKNCISWLDKQPEKSVIYVSIGSLALMANEHFMEIWHGLVNSEVRFLWVQRPGSIKGLEQEKDEIHWELARATKERGCIVSWAPQEEVLAHPAVGGFLTHAGWNSTLESIVEGVPMICWPYFADQQINSRYVGEVWKLGMDMKDTCDRGIVEMMVRDLMKGWKDEFLARMENMARLAEASVDKGGSSYNALNRLIEDIKLMSLQKQNLRTFQACIPL